MAAEAAEAALRDRPGVYDAYHVGDICNLNSDASTDLHTRSFNTLICLSAMALGHVEPDATGLRVRLGGRGHHPAGLGSRR